MAATSSARATLLAAGLALLGGCGPEAGSRASAGVIRAEGACNLEGLSKPLRQTVVLVDGKAIHKSADGAEFATRNTAFRDLILSIADPEKAIASGFAAPRERVIIAVVPADGSAAEVAFDGCIPAMSPDELSKATGERSVVSNVFSAGPAGQLAKDADMFRTQLIGGLVAAAAKAEGEPSAQTGPLARSRLLEGLRASKAMFETKERVQRLIIVSDLSALTLPTDGGETPFDRGVAAGRTAQGDFSRSEVQVVLPAGRALPDRDFLRGYFLAQNARLTSVASAKVGPATPAPARLWRFTGEARYPSGPQLIDVQLGEDGAGKLAGAWLSVLAETNMAIPLTGQIVCSGGGSCRITSDEGGFAQAWTASAGRPPRFDNELPFGGMRSFALEIADNQLTGRVFDEAVYLGSDTNQNSVPIKAELKQ